MCVKAVEIGEAERQYEPVITILWNSLLKYLPYNLQHLIQLFFLILLNNKQTKNLLYQLEISAS